MFWPKQPNSILVACKQATDSEREGENHTRRSLCFSFNWRREDKVDLFNPTFYKLHSTQTILFDNFTVHSSTSLSVSLVRHTGYRFTIAGYLNRMVTQTWMILFSRQIHLLSVTLRFTCEPAAKTENLI